MVRLADVLALGELALRPVHLADADATLRWVATSELVDPAPFLEGGELLLTTGLSTRGWRREWDDYVARLVAADVAALGLATGLTHARTPAGLIRACERHRLNLVEVPRNTPFVAVSRATAALLEEAGQQEARDALRLQRALITAALAARDGSRIAPRLARLVDGAAATLAPDGQLEAAPSGPLSTALDLGDVRAELARIRPQGLRAASSSAVDAGTLHLHPIGAGPRPAGYLAVLLPGRPSEAERGAVRTAVALLGLASERSAERRDADRALHGRSLELLLSGDERGALLVAGGASRPARLPDRVCVVRARGATPSGSGVGDLVAALEDAGVLVGWHGAELVAVVAVAGADGVAGEMATAGLRAGIGEPVRRSAVPDGHRTAGHALERTTDETPVVAWQRVVRAGVLGLLDADRAEDFAHSLLAPLAEAPELRDTLLTFLTHHGSRLRVADELGIHRNTVRHRLAHVERLTGLDLDDAEHRVRAWIALQASPASPASPRRSDA